MESCGTEQDLRECVARTCFRDQVLRKKLVIVNPDSSGTAITVVIPSQAGIALSPSLAQRLLVLDAVTGTRRFARDEGVRPNRANNFSREPVRALLSSTGR
jgi:hypothetical protein